MSRDHKLIFVGTATQREFRGGGIDDGKDYPIDCKQNDEIFVTEGKKYELLKDHPEWFVEPGKAKVESKTEPTVEKSKLPPSVVRKDGEQPKKKKRGMKELRRIAKNKNIKVPFGISIDDLEELVEPKN
ncbi:hypothetical protein LCGC14_2085640 [marine sediment metagenome]|uniref:Uncharacterized protein n=2 Tax=root TaxID=1 RepID=A0A831VTM3_9FLAO|nr:hypothetical protein [Pricia antarctica]